MKTLLIYIFSILFTAGCETTTPNPILIEIDGKWKLIKIGIGFPAPGSPTEKVPEYEEILEFNATKESFTRSRDGKVVEKSGVSISEDDKASIRRFKLVFEDSKTYSYMTITDSPKYLMLYQRAPLDTQVADGNLFFYEKIK